MILWEFLQSRQKFYSVKENFRNMSAKNKNEDQELIHGNGVIEAMLSVKLSRNKNAKCQPPVFPNEQVWRGPGCVGRVEPGVDGVPKVKKIEQDHSGHMGPPTCEQTDRLTQLKTLLLNIEVVSNETNTDVRIYTCWIY